METDKLINEVIKTKIYKDVIVWYYDAKLVNEKTLADFDNIIENYGNVERLLVNKNGAFGEQRVDPFLYGKNLINVYPKEVKIFKEEKWKI